MRKQLEEDNAQKFMLPNGFAKINAFLTAN